MNIKFCKQLETYKFIFTFFIFKGISKLNIFCNISRILVIPFNSIVGRSISVSFHMQNSTLSKSSRDLNDALLVHHFHIHFELHIFNKLRVVLKRAYEKLSNYCISSCVWIGDSIRHLFHYVDVVRCVVDSFLRHH